MICIVTYLCFNLCACIFFNIGDHEKEEWCRKVEEEFTPQIGQVFDKLEDGVNFYNVYALASGFDVRRSTTKKYRDGSLKYKLLVCNREGHTEQRTVAKVNDNSETSSDDTIKRSNKIRRIGCKARLRLSMKGGVFVVDIFHEVHNHVLVSIRHREFQKLSRHLSTYHKEVIVHNSRVSMFYFARIINSVESMFVI